MIIEGNRGVKIEGGSTRQNRTRNIEIFVKNFPMGSYNEPDGSSTNTVEWGLNKITWYCNDSYIVPEQDIQFNRLNTTYYWVVI